MKKLWLAVGNLIAFCSTPVLYFYLRRSERTRVLLRSDNQILVVRGWLGSQQWSLPGGGLHKSEDPARGACREVFEETAVRLEAGDLKMLGKFKGGKGIIKYAYYGFSLNVEEKITLVIKGWEIIEAKWVPITELNHSNASADVMNMLTVLV